MNFSVPESIECHSSAFSFVTNTRVCSSLSKSSNKKTRPGLENLGGFLIYLRPRHPSALNRFFRHSGQDILVLRIWQFPCHILQLPFCPCFFNIAVFLCFRSGFAPCVLFLFFRFYFLLFTFYEHEPTSVAAAGVEPAVSRL